MLPFDPNKIDSIFKYPDLSATFFGRDRYIGISVSTLFKPFFEG